MRVLILAFVIVTAAIPLVPFVSAQSLADVARKEEERRRAARPAEKGKVYTNGDLGGAPVPPPAVPAPAQASAPAVPDAAGASAAKDAQAGEAAAAKEPPKDQAYWAGRMKQLRTKLDRDQVYADALQTRVNSLTADITNRDDPAQRGKLIGDRQKALDELATLKQAIVEGGKAIADLEEEARRARVPPGWLR
jgi:hypothetical protein